MKSHQSYSIEISKYRNNSFGNLMKYIWKKRFLYALLFFPLLYFAIFQYGPMYGILMAFVEYIPGKSIFQCNWRGFYYFQLLFQSQPFLQSLLNTILISIYTLILGFPFPIIITIMLNEVRNKYYKSFVQTVFYFPYFISWIIVGGILLSFLSINDGLVNLILKQLGFDAIPFMSDARYFRALLVISGIWKNFGWYTIIYLAAVSCIDIQQYEAAFIDGANRLQQIIYITLPGIASTIIVIFIIQLSNILNVGIEQVLPLLNSQVAETGEIIDTYVYKVGLVNADYSFATASGLFKSIVGFMLLTFVNQLSKKINGESVY